METRERYLIEKERLDTELKAIKFNLTVGLNFLSSTTSSKHRPRAGHVCTPSCLVVQFKECPSFYQCRETGAVHECTPQRCQFIQRTSENAVCSATGQPVVKTNLDGAVALSKDERDKPAPRCDPEPVLAKYVSRLARKKATAEREKELLLDGIRSKLFVPRGLERDKVTVDLLMDTLLREEEEEKRKKKQTPTAPSTAVVVGAIRHAQVVGTVSVTPAEQKAMDALERKEKAENKKRHNMRMQADGLKPVQRTKPTKAKKRAKTNGAALAALMPESLQSNARAILMSFLPNRPYKPEELASIEYACERCSYLWRLVSETVTGRPLRFEYVCVAVFFKYTQESYPRSTKQQPTGEGVFRCTQDPWMILNMPDPSRFPSFQYRGHAFSSHTKKETEMSLQVILHNFDSGRVPVPEWLRMERRRASNPTLTQRAIMRETEDILTASAPVSTASVTTSAAAVVPATPIPEKTLGRLSAWLTQ